MAAVKAAVAIPVIVNGDIETAEDARAALHASGADALMLGRGVYGRPWLAAHLDRALKDGTKLQEPEAPERLAIVLDHFRQTLDFYGEHLGSRMFRKHLGWYIERAPWPDDPAERRVAKGRLCRLDDPADVEAALTYLWLGGEVPHIGNSTVESGPQGVHSVAA